MTNLINKILRDPFIPVILIFSLIISLILVAKFRIPLQSSVLGITDPAASQNNCQINQCGYCRNCGTLALSGAEGLACGPLSRCRKEKDNFICKFDLQCLNNY